MAGCSTGPERLKGQLPRDYVVAHKTGSGFTLPGGGVTARNDVGIIVLPNGRKWRFPCSSGIQRILNPLVTG